MNRPDQHPDTETLDQLRAGLLDDDPARKSELEAHLKRCEQCRRLYDWPGAIAGPDLETGQLDRRLDQAPNDRDHCEICGHETAGPK